MKIEPFKEINPPNDKGYWINKKTNQSFGGQYASPVLLENLKKLEVGFKKAMADKSFNELDSKMIYDAAVAGDKVALEVFEITGKFLGQGLADTVHHLSPEAIFLFGGPTAAGEMIFEPTRRNMEENLLPVFRNKIKILPSKLDAGDAAIVGASALAWKELEK